MTGKVLKHGILEGKVVEVEVLVERGQSMRRHDNNVIRCAGFVINLNIDCCFCSCSIEMADLNVNNVLTLSCSSKKKKKRRVFIDAK